MSSLFNVNQLIGHYRPASLKPDVVYKSRRGNAVDSIWVVLWKNMKVFYELLCIIDPLMSSKLNRKYSIEYIFQKVHILYMNTNLAKSFRKQSINLLPNYDFLCEMFFGAWHTQLQSHPISERQRRRERAVAGIVIAILSSFLLRTLPVRDIGHSGGRNPQDEW